jgi:ligand-binding sensor domain-containing protein
MKKRTLLIVFQKVVLFFSIVVLNISCEKIDEDLKDPSLANKWTVFNTSNGLSGNQVRGILCDSKGNMWFAVSSNGAAKLSNNTWAYYKTSNSGILSNGVTCVEEDATGNIFFGTTNGISILSPTNTWSYYRDPNVTMNVSVIKTMSNKDIWIGTTNRGYYIIKGNTISRYDISSLGAVNDIEQDSKNNIWIGTDSGLIRYDGTNYSYMSTTNGLPDNIVTALFSDSKNRLWIGTYYGKTVSWLDTQGIHQVSLFNGGAISEINDICEDARGNIWFATYDSGLIEYDGVVPFSHKKYNGFPENDIISSDRDNDGNVWFGLYSKGAVRYSLPID